MSPDNKPLCLVPARGGSKRFPGKNLAMLGGKPLIAWTLESAFASGVADEVWVSSDDSGILDFSRSMGASLISRPAELATDLSSLEDVGFHAIKVLAEMGRSFSTMYVMTPTSPFRRSKTIRAAWEAFRGSDADSLISVIPADHPPQWSIVENDGWARPLFPEGYETQRQHLEPTFRPDGGHVIADIVKLEQNGVFMGERTMMFPVPIEEAVDVDEPLDLTWAEFLLDRGMIGE